MVNLMSQKPTKNPVAGRNGGTLHPGDHGQGATGGRPKGVRNRSTVVREFLDATLKTKNPITGLEETLTVEQRMALSMIAQVLTKGNVQAWNSIKDDVYGKLKDKLEVDSNIKLTPSQILESLERNSKDS